MKMLTLTAFWIVTGVVAGLVTSGFWPGSAPESPSPGYPEKQAMATRFPDHGQPARRPPFDLEHLSGQALVDDIMKIRKSLNRKSVVTILDPLAEDGATTDPVALFRQSVEQIAGVSRPMELPAESTCGIPGPDSSSVLSGPSTRRSTGVQQLAGLLGALNRAGRSADVCPPGGNRQLDELQAELQARIDAGRNRP